ncbi:MAG: NAD(P)H-dependent oxidoreductase [Gammaproteobacteria bacterium]|nr:NAD(P)H-dependent oxidoreductase [Gammaproteobacteria bacterium]
MNNVLLINAHQIYEGMSGGELNRYLVEVVASELESIGSVVKHTTIEAGYEIEEEVAKHLWADLIIVQGPVYWFSLPWIHKKYTDEVLTAGLLDKRFVEDDGRTRKDRGMQYGTGGKMTDKRYMLSLTWNAPAEAFGDPGQFLFEGKTVDDIFVGNTANYRFCGVQILPSFSCYNVVKAPEIAADVSRLKAHLKRYCQSVPTDQPMPAETDTSAG